jgi:DNA end-binding protein Ku
LIWRSNIVTQKAADFEPEKFEDHYESALTELINAKRNGKTITAKPRPRGENVVDLMDALKKSLVTEAAAPKGKKSRKASAGQKEMLLPIEGKKPAAKEGGQAGAVCWSAESGIIFDGAKSVPQRKSLKYEIPVSA